MNICEQLKQYCDVDNSNLKINGEVYKIVAKQIGLNEFPYPKYDDAQFPKDNKEFAKFVILSNIINFVTFTGNYNKLTWVFKGVEYRGSEALAMALKSAIDTDLIKLDFGYFASDEFTPEILNKVFGAIENTFMDKKGVLYENKRFLMIKNFSKQFIAKYKSFEDFFDQCEGYSCGSRGLIERLAELYGYNQDRLFFYKRASLCAYMIHSRGLATNDEALQFWDIIDLPPLADSHVFRYLAVEQIIFLEPYFGYRLFCRTPFNDSNPDDFNLICNMRACSAYGMLLLLDGINEFRRQNDLDKISIIQLDNFVWRASRSSEILNYYPYMLTTNC